MLITGARLADGELADVLLADSRLVGVGPPGTLGPRDPVLDLTGFVLLPAPAEPHAHLDKALCAEQAPNPTGDLLSAITAWHTFQDRHLDAGTLHADTVARASAAAQLMLANGTTAVRSHVDVGGRVGLAGLRALVEVRDALADRLVIQLVALVAPGEDSEQVLRAALAAGADVAGGCPHLDPDPVGTQLACLRIARDLGVRVDLHTDETLDPAVLLLADLPDQVRSLGLSGRVAASHCVSLGMQPAAVAAAVAGELADTATAVVSLPQTNLFLQGRQAPARTPRGLTALRALLDAGVVVAGGADNLQDPFNTMGRGDALETASLLVTAGHLSTDEAWRAVSAAPRAVLGLDAITLDSGHAHGPADLLGVPAPSLRAAIAGAPAGRVVIRSGQVVAGSP